MGGEGNTTVPNAGEALTRTYNVTNEGTTTLSNVCVTDDKLGAECLACTVPGDGELPPGGLMVCTIHSSVSHLRLGQHLQPNVSLQPCVVPSRESMGRNSLSAHSSHLFSRSHNTQIEGSSP